MDIGKLERSVVQKTDSAQRGRRPEHPGKKRDRMTSNPLADAQRRRRRRRRIPTARGGQQSGDARLRGS
jgi:hypothetical protein